jgi:hypothetical protein
MTGKRAAWKTELILYSYHVLAVFRPGVRVPVHEAHPTPPADTSGWSETGQRLLLEEGRRQLDRQQSDLKDIRGRAQALLTTTLAFGAVVTATLDPIAAAGLLAFVIWVLAATATLLCLLGTAAIVTARAEFAGVDTALLTHSEGDVLAALAAGHADAVRVGENTIATRLTVLRDAVLMLLLAAALMAAAWWIGVITR